jgi:uncharacterized protein YcaQ
MHWAFRTIPRVTPIELDRAEARRFLAARHLLAPPRSLPAGPGSVMAVVERLGSLQFDPLEIAGRNHDLVLAARIAGYRRETIDALLYGSRELYETYNKGLSIVPTRELPLYRITWDENRAEHDGGTFDEHAPLVEELLDRIRRDGPLAAADVEPRAAIDWYWRPTNQVRAILEALAEAGILALARRDGNRRVYDLTERLFPAAVLAERPPVHQQRRHKLLSRFRAHGLLGRSGSAEPWIGTVAAKRSAADPARPTRGELIDELVDDGAIHSVAVEGVRGPRYVVDADLALLESVSSERSVPGGADAEPAVPGVAFLAPLDPLVWDRDLLRRLYDFDYVWEVYVPEARRRWGYYVLPLLYGDRLVGRIEPRIDRRAGVLRVLDVWWEAGFDPLDAPGFDDALTDALVAHARFAGVTRIALPRTARHRDLAAAVRARLGPRGRIRA